MSEYPPPFQGQTVRKNNSTKIVLIILGIVALTCLGGVAFGAFFVFKVAKQVVPRAGCTIEFTEVRGAIKAYAKEHDGNLPPALSWQDDVRPYLITIQSKDKEKRGPLGGMDVNGSWGCTTPDDKHTGMAFNT